MINAVLGIFSISKGGISGIVTDVRIIFQSVLKSNASGIIVCHKHPSGNENPSESDRRITQKIKDAGSLLDIQLLKPNSLLDSSHTAPTNGPSFCW